MEIKLQGTALPCVAQQDIKAGLAVKLGPARASGVAISTPNVIQGASLQSGDDLEARFVAGFRVYNEKPPIYENLPSLNQSGNTTTQPYTLREFVSGTENLPADVKLRMVAPRLKDSAETILSGALMLAYDDGVYTVTSGCYTASANLTVGAFVKSTAGGVWAYTATAAEKVGIVWEYDAADQKLTIKTGR